MKYYAGIDIGGTRIKMGIINELGEVIVNENEETKKEKLELFTQIDHFIKRHPYQIEGVGLSTPGVIRSDGYAQTSGAIHCFLNCYVQQELEAFLHLPVIVENDTKSAAMAEKWIGAAKDEDSFACLTLGTAVGGAIYMNGQLVRGLGGLAGEFGVALSSLQPGDYNEHSFSYHAATVAGLCREYSYSVKERVLDARVIIERSQQGDEVAKLCLSHFYHAVAVLFVNIAVMIAPEVIIVGGGISENQEVMEAIEEEYQNICKDYHVLSLVEMPHILTCQLKNDAGMIGAVYSFLRRYKKINDGNSI